MTVVTRNLADFEATGVAMINPWDPMAVAGQRSAEPVIEKDN
jgi:hypothetical protein